MCSRPTFDSGKQRVAGDGKQTSPVRYKKALQWINAALSDDVNDLGTLVHGTSDVQEEHAPQEEHSTSSSSSSSEEDGDRGAARAPIQPAAHSRPRGIVGVAT